MNALTVTIEDPTEMVDAAFDEPVMCESGYCRDELRRKAHAAQWYALGPCGTVDAVCTDRRRRVRNADGWRCDPGCGHWHFYDDIEWTKIEKG